MKENNFIVKNELQAYQEWLEQIVGEVKDLAYNGYKVKMNKGKAYDVIYKNKLTDKEKLHIMNLAEKYVRILDKIKELKKEKEK